MGTMTAVYSEEAGAFARLLRRALNQRRGMSISYLKSRYGRSEVNGWLRDGSSGHHPSFPNKRLLRDIAEELEVDLGILESVVSRSKKAAARDKRINQVNSKMVS